MSPTGLITQLIAPKAAQQFSSGDPCPTPLTPVTAPTPFRQHRSFIVIHGSAQSPYFPIEAGVSQGSILSPLLYSVYTSDIPEHPATLLTSFADDTAILSTNSDPTLASLNLQSHLTTLQTRCSNWKFRGRDNVVADYLFRIVNAIDSPSPTLGVHEEVTWDPESFDLSFLGAPEGENLEPPGLGLLRRRVEEGSGLPAIPEAATGMTPVSRPESERGSAERRELLWERGSLINRPKTRRVN
ncbi:hypothetical protein AAG570_003826 [Ranatra chinensis]|uniref:Reverse transcriptase domain-containing protein n=1 Tax=Ranatra chinensis TaxID=642074 RepID=A0ABD0Y2R6_9HEMI